MSNSFMLAVVPPKGMGQVVPLALVNRPALEDLPVSSLRLKPAPGTCVSASFSQGSRVMWYSPEPLGSTNSISMFRRGLPDGDNATTPKHALWRSRRLARENVRRCRRWDETRSHRADPK